MLWVPVLFSSPFKHPESATARDNFQPNPNLVFLERELYLRKVSIGTYLWFQKHPIDREGVAV